MKLNVMQEERVTPIKPKLVTVTRESGIPLLGALPFGIIDRGTNLLQVRCTSLCNMRCTFCSTSANDFNIHSTNYLVDVDYLTEEVEKIARFKGGDVIIFLDSVGEPMSHPHFVDLVRKLKQIQEVKETFLTKEKIDSLFEAGLTQINLSIHSLNENLSKKLFGSDNYDVENIKKIIPYILQKKLDLMITPVWIPGINDVDIEEIIVFAKEHGCKVGLQKYEVYKYSRKIKGVKTLTYWKFYYAIKKLEKKYDMSLIVRARDVHVEKRLCIPNVFSIGENVFVDIVCSGWMSGQMIGKSKNRCISINRCQKDVGDKVKVKIIQNKNKIYLAELS